MPCCQVPKGHPSGSNEHSGPLTIQQGLCSCRPLGFGRFLLAGTVIRHRHHGNKKADRLREGLTLFLSSPSTSSISFCLISPLPFSSSLSSALGSDTLVPYSILSSVRSTEPDERGGGVRQRGQRETEGCLVCVYGGEVDQLEL